MFSHADLIKHLSYDADTGLFTRNVSSKRWKTGQVAGSISRKGYVQVRLLGVCVKASRLAFFYMNGEWPKHQVDHINRVRDDNRWCNLREATASENAQNRKHRADSLAQLIGVGWRKDIAKWSAQIRINQKLLHLGYYGAKEDAHAAYVQAKKSLHTFNPAVEGAL